MYLEFQCVGDYQEGCEVKDLYGKPQIGTRRDGTIGVELDNDCKYYSVESSNTNIMYCDLHATTSSMD